MFDEQTMNSNRYKKVIQEVLQESESLVKEDIKHPLLFALWNICKQSKTINDFHISFGLFLEARNTLQQKIKKG